VDSMTAFVERAMVDVSAFDSELVEGELRPVGEALTDHLVGLVVTGDGVAVCHGAAAVAKRHGVDIHTEDGAAVARDFMERVFRAFTVKVDVAKHTPLTMGYDRIAAMDVDGYNKNTSFTPNSDHTETREFLTTKCVHFDAATPFIGNVYGPNINIKGGRPIVCNTRDYCKDHEVAPGDLIEVMPHSYNVAVREEHSDAILAEYSGAVDVDLTEDLVMVVLNNEVTGGIAHAGSIPQLADPAKDGRRPIRHMEYQFADGQDLERWYVHYGLDLPSPTLQVPDEAARERYHLGVGAAVPAGSPESAG
jgi:hypothetical protein